MRHIFQRIYSSILLITILSHGLFAQLTMSQISEPLVNFQTEIDLDAQYPIVAVAHNVGPDTIIGNELEINFSLFTVNHYSVLFQTATAYHVTIGPGDTIGVPLIFSLPSSVYYAYGGGTTIIIWPAMAGYPTLDSLEVPIYIIPFSGLNDEDDASINLYPNPSSQGFISITGVKNLDKGYVYSLDGKLIKAINFTTNSEVDNNTISTNELKKGIYLIRLIDKEGNVYNKKVVVD